jgi:hypothetical protein
MAQHHENMALMIEHRPSARRLHKVGLPATFCFAKDSIFRDVARYADVKLLVVIGLSVGTPVCPKAGPSVKTVAIDSPIFLIIPLRLQPAKPLSRSFRYFKGGSQSLRPYLRFEFDPRFLDGRFCLFETIATPMTTARYRDGNIPEPVFPAALSRKPDPANGVSVINDHKVIWPD